MLAYLKLAQRSFPGAHFFHLARNRETKYFLPGKVVWIELRLQQDKKKIAILLQECKEVLQIGCQYNNLVCNHVIDFRNTHMVSKGLINLQKKSFILSYPSSHSNKPLFCLDHTYSTV